MKILHTADWHLGKKLEFFNRLPEQQAVLDEIVAIAEAHQVDAVVVAGDLYDSYNPPVEAIELLYTTLKKLTRNGACPVIAIAGNHDSAERVESPESLARECGIFFAGYPDSELPTCILESGVRIVRSDKGFCELSLPAYDYNLRLLLTPYANEIRLKQYFGLEDGVENINQYLKTHWAALSEKYCDVKGINLLVAHLYMMQKGGEMPEEPDDERPICIGNASAVYSENIPSTIQYTALGHLHRSHSVGVASVQYCGSPLSYSFAESEQQKYVHIVDVEPGNPSEVEKVSLHQGRTLLRKTFESIDEAVEWLQVNDNILIEVTIVCDDYILAADKKRLLQANDGIISIIPKMRTNNEVEVSANNVDISLNIQELFQQYFVSKKQQNPNQELIDLFKEVLAQKEG